MPEPRIAIEPASLLAANSAEAPAITNQNSFRHIIAGAFLLSLFWAGVCVLQAQQSGSAAVEQNQNFSRNL